jgi:glycerate 2-kinase
MSPVVHPPVLLKPKNSEMVKYDLTNMDNIFIIGAGKATFRQALAMDEILGDRITAGLVVLKHGQGGPLNHINILESGHPVPDDNSFIAGQEIIKLVERAGEKDLVICLMSGGVSANCCCPVDGITDTDKMEMNRLLVTSGAQVTELMTVRRHLSKIKGGRLGLMIQPATCITLTVSDTVGDPLEWNADWTHPDSSTFQDAIDTDGTDGPTEYAGALTDGFSVARAKEKGIDFHKELMAHNPVISMIWWV